jgi:serine/threonine protein kinase
VNCPSQSQLSEFVLGKLPLDELDLVSSHVDGCASCQAGLEDVSGDRSDVLVSRLQGPAAEQPHCDEQPYLAALAQVKEMAGGAVLLTKPKPERKTSGDAAVTVLRDYRILEKLGEGGMGAVYKALHTKLDKTVAIKVLAGDRMRDEHAVERFTREMKAVGRLEHPNIVQASDAGEVDGRHFLVMQYVKGIDLSALIEKTGPLPIAEACELVRQAAEGLQYVAENGMVHRDIKPSNLMLTANGAVKVLDLGLALLHDHPTDSANERTNDDAPVDGNLTSAGQLMGTLDYMAPEQCDDSHQVDIRADIYSLGATLYKLLAGRAPFDDQRYDTPMKKMMALTYESPTPIRKLRPDVPELLSQVLHRMIAKGPSQRFKSPAQVATALLPFAETADVSGWLAGAIGGSVGDASVESLMGVDAAETIVSKEPGSTSDGFDPYHVWLSIPPDEQPPHHYRLLGLKPFESDLQVIESAADRQMTHVRTFQSGKHSKSSQKLLNEISTAKLCLLKDPKKQAYDEKLEAKLAEAEQRKQAPAQPSAPPPAKPAAKPAPKQVAVQPDAPSVSAFKFEKREPATSTAAQASKKSPNWLLIGGGSAAALLLVIIVAMFAMQGDDPPIAYNDLDTTSSENDGDARGANDDPIPNPGAARETSTTNRRTNGTSGDSTPMPAPPIRSFDGSIDLIAHLKNNMTTGRRPFMEGDWEVNGGVLQKTTDGVGDRVGFPYSPAGDYRLDVQFVRKQGSESTVIFLPVGRGYAAAVFANDYAGLGGFKSLYSSEDSNPTKNGKFRIVEGKAHTAVIEVRLQGEAADVRVNVDGKPLIRQVALQNEFAMTTEQWRGGKPIGVAVRLATNIEFNRITVTPLDASPTTATPVTTVAGEPVDLIDGVRQRLASTDNKPFTVGKWQVIDSTLRKTERGELDRIELPFTPTWNYRLNVGLNPGAGTREVFLYLPVGRHGVNVVLTTSHVGIGNLKGLRHRDEGNPTMKREFRLEKTKQHNVIVDVLLRGANADINIDIDDRQLIRWSGRQEDLAPQAGFDMPNPQMIAVGAWQSPIDFSAITIAPLKLVAEPPSTAVAASGKPIDLIQHTVDHMSRTRQEPVMNGRWWIDKRVLRNIVTTKSTSVELPYQPQSSYRLTTTFVRQKGIDIVMLRIPVGAANVLVGLGGADDWSALSDVKGIKFSNTKNPTRTQEFKLVNGQRHTVTTDVRLDGEKASILVTADDQPIITWSGPQTDLSNSNVADKKSIAVGIYKGHVGFEHITIQPLDSDAPTEVAVTDSKPAIRTTSTVATGQPIDVLERVAQMVASGKQLRGRHGVGWKFNNGVLSVQPRWMDRIPLPYKTTDSYRLRVRFVRKQGGNMALVLLPVGKSQVTLVLCDRNGLSGLERVKGRALENNDTRKREFKIVTGQEHEVFAEVRLDGDKATVHVDVDDLELVRWSGPQSDLMTDPGSSIPDITALGVGASESAVEFRAISVQPLSGKFAVVQLADKLPIPAPEQSDAAAKLARDFFEDEIKAAKTAEEKSNIGVQLLDTAAKSEGEPTERFALMRLAYDFAIEAANIELISHSIAALDGVFDVDTLNLRAFALDKATKQSLSPEQAAALTSAMLDLMADGEAAERYDIARRKLWDLATKTASRAKQRELVTAVRLRVKDSRSLGGQFKAFRDAKEALAKDDGDEAANLTAGTYRCFVQGDWDAGIPNLAKGNNAALKELADQELAVPETVEAQVQLAKAWRDNASKTRDHTKDARLARAAHWYKVALPNAKGLLLTKIKQELEALGKSGVNTADESKKRATGPTAKTKQAGAVVVKPIGKMPGFAVTLTFSPDGSLLAASHSQSISIWDGRSGKKIKTIENAFPGWVHCVAFTPDGRTLAACGSESSAVKFWKVSDWSLLHTMKTERAKAPWLSFSPDGNLLATASGQAFIDVWHGKKLTKLFSTQDGNPETGITFVEFSPDGKTIASTDARGQLVFHDLSGKRLGLVQLDRSWQQFKALTWSPSSRIVAVASKVGHIHYVDAQSFKEIGQIKGHTGELKKVAFTPVSWPAPLLVSTGEDATVRLWNPTTGKQLAQLPGHEQTTWGIAFSPDGWTLATSAMSKEIILWDVQISATKAASARTPSPTPKPN